jgi:hypothetical protein
MASEEIYMDFDAQDNPVISVKGVKGQKCRALTADLESALGNTTSTEHTAEYKEKEVVNANRSAHQRR